MSDTKGMNAATVRAHSHSLGGQLDMIEHAKGELTKAILVSQNPLEYLLSPGSLILAPYSITQLGMANAELILAGGSARELVAKLIAEAEAQEFVSESDDASYLTAKAWKTPDTKTIPDLNPWDFVGGPVNLLKTLADAVGTVAGYVATAAEWAKKYGPDILKKVVKFWDDLPPWAKSLKRFGRALPWLGTAVSAVDLGVAISKGDVWGIVRSGVSIGLDIASEVATGTIVGAPVGLVLAGVGIVWDLSWDAGERIKNVFDHQQEMGKYWINNPGMAVLNVLAPVTMDWWGPIAN